MKLRLIYKEKSVAVRVLDAAVLLFGGFLFFSLALSYLIKYTGDASPFLEALRPYWMLISGLFAHLMLSRLLVGLFRVCRLRLDRFQWIGAGVATVVLAGLYGFCVLSRDIIYFWDFAGYYTRQLELNASFALGLRDGFAALRYSTWYSNYGLFINLFTSVPFCFTSMTGDAYILSAFFDIMPYIVVLCGGLCAKLSRQLNVTNPRAFYLLSMLSLVCLPILHAAFLLGQPDVLGVLFALCVILATMDYAFESVDAKRLLLIAAFAFCLVITRRWYVMWAAGYFACYGLLTVVNILLDPRKELRKKRLLLLLGYAACCAAAFGIALFPYIKKSLAFDYATNYAYYLNGGFPGEVRNQAGILGVFCLLVMLAGFLFSLRHKTVRTLGLSSGMGALITLFLFTRIQNMGYHQALLLVPGYLVLLILGCAAVCSIKRRGPALFGCGFIAACLALNLAGSGANMESVRKSPAFSSVSLRTPSREDKAQVAEITDYLLNACREGETAYIIPHSGTYNPSVFRCVHLPDQRAWDVIDYGAGMLGEHKFPVELLTATYVLTCDPLSYASLECKYNDAFLNGGYLAERFTLEKSVDMGNGYTFYLYRRIVPIDVNEVLEYRKRLAEENKRYPYLYWDVIDAFIAENGWTLP